MIIYVHTKPGSKLSAVTQEDVTHYTVRVRERAVDGKANEAVIQALSKHFGCAKSSVVIRSGHASKMKKVEIL